MSDARRHRAAGVALVLVALAFTFSGPARSIFNTVVFTLFPGRATLQVAPGNVRVKAGSPLGINARVVNGATAAAQIEIGDGKLWKTLDMARTPDGLFRLRLDAVTTPEKYRVLADGLASPTYAIDIAFPPHVTHLDLDYAYPADARVRPWTEDYSGDIYGPLDTQVRVHVHTDRPAAGGQLTLENGESFPLTVEHADDLTVVLRVEGDNTYRVSLAGPDGLTSLDDTRHLIRVIPGR